jgi:hypothetical protein
MKLNLLNLSNLPATINLYAVHGNYTVDGKETIEVVPLVYIFSVDEIRHFGS